MHKNVHRGAHGCLQVIGLEPIDSRRVALPSGLCFGVLEVKDSLGMKKLHWDVAPDALPGSAINACTCFGPLA